MRPDGWPTFLDYGYMRQRMAEIVEKRPGISGPEWEEYVALWREVDRRLTAAEARQEFRALAENAVRHSTPPGVAEVERLRTVPTSRTDDERVSGGVSERLVRRSQAGWGEAMNAEKLPPHEFGEVVVQYRRPLNRDTYTLTAQRRCSRCKWTFYFGFDVPRSAMAKLATGDAVVNEVMREIAAYNLNRLVADEQEIGCPGPRE